MTRDEVLAMPAGDDLDRLVAETIMGWKDVRIEFIPGYGCPGMSLLFGLAPDGKRRSVPDYSTGIAPAWEVVERFRPYVKVDGRGINPATNESCWSCSVWVGGPEVEAFADIAPLAICRAALAAAMP